MTQGTTFNVFAQTALGDLVAYEESRLNLYVYPVIGRTGHPASQPGCPDSEKRPLTVVFSGADSITVPQHTEGSTLEWYQPPWEPGNVLSYPGSLGQLQAFEATLMPLTQPLGFHTDQLRVQKQTQSSVTTNDEATTGSTANYSADASVSMTAAGELFGFDVTATASFSVSGSKAFESLNTSVTTLGQATGVLVQKPGTFHDPSNYAYGVTAYLFGQAQPGGSVNDLPLSTDVTTFGILQAAFLVDPLNAPAGGWWRQTYTTPDVALNHPMRWQITLSTTDPSDGTCLVVNPGSSDVDCAALSPAFPGNPKIGVGIWMPGAGGDVRAFGRGDIGTGAPGTGTPLDLDDHMRVTVHRATWRLATPRWRRAPVR